MKKLIKKLKYSNIYTNLKTIYYFKSMKLKQYVDDNGIIESTVNLRINGKCDCLFLTEHKYMIVSWIFMFKKLPNMYNQLYYYCK